MNDVARQLLRAMRGRRSQVGFSRRLGYASNVATDWESGRRIPTAAEALRAADRVGVDVRAAFEAFHPGAAPALDDGVAAWLMALTGGTSQSDLATRSGRSRHQVGRWLRGDAEPRLHDFLALVDALTGRVDDLVGRLVPIARVPALADRAATRRAAQRLMLEAPGALAVRTLLGTGRSGAVGEVAARLGWPEVEVRDALDALLEAGLVEPVRGRYRATGRYAAGVRGTAEERRALRLAWSDLSRRRLVEHPATDLFGFNVFAVSEPDLDRIRELYRAFYREVRSIVAASSPPERAALLLVHLVDWGGLP